MGPEVTPAVRPGLDVLFMSGYPDDVIAERGVLDSDVAFVQKPFSVRSLVGKAREELERPRRDAQPAIL